ncbi:hypothetical protein ACQPZP_44005 [Spirillospora sp. CA-142024]|uniref:hypothetical protein n=1 Tax=Spirillospora sp. CA-142024 TaxID=3240036 RepID=UPI003D915F0D
MKQNSVGRVAALATGQAPGASRESLRPGTVALWPIHYMANALGRADAILNQSVGTSHTVLG